MSTDILVIVDDNSTAFSYSWSGGNSSSSWSISNLTQWYGGTTRYPESSGTRTGTFTFTFNGTSAAFVGNTPASSEPQSATVQIDNGTSFDVNYGAPQTYMQWFSTPRLADGEHNITISNLYGTAIDYAVVTVGNDTSLIEQTIVTDGDSPLVQYSGQWSRNTSEFIPGSLPPGYPYGNATHLSSNPGDTFTFQFNGTSIAVYGIFSWNNLGLLSATYSIDNSTYSSSIPVTTSSQGYLNQDGEVSNYQYFGLNSLSPGVHTLLVNITEANNQTFMLNYITYSPAFDTLASLPSLSSSASGSSTSYTSSTTSSLPSTTPTISSDMSRRSVPTILGGVILALVFSVFGTIMLVSLILRRRRVREQKLAFQHEILTDGYNPDWTRQHEPGFLTGNSHTQYIHPTDSQHA